MNIESTYTFEAANSSQPNSRQSYSTNPSKKKNKKKILHPQLATTKRNSSDQNSLHISVLKPLAKKSSAASLSTTS